MPVHPSIPPVICRTHGGGGLQGGGAPPPVLSIKTAMKRLKSEDYMLISAHETGQHSLQDGSGIQGYPRR
jgi:hypothetical protein